MLNTLTNGMLIIVIEWNRMDRTIITNHRMNRNAILVRSTPFRTWATETSIIENRVFA